MLILCVALEPETREGMGFAASQFRQRDDDGGGSDLYDDDSGDVDDGDNADGGNDGDGDDDETL